MTTSHKIHLFVLGLLLVAVVGVSLATEKEGNDLISTTTTTTTQAQSSLQESDKETGSKQRGQSEGKAKEKNDTKLNLGEEVKIPPTSGKIQDQNKETQKKNKMTAKEERKREKNGVVRKRKEEVPENLPQALSQTQKG